MLKESSEELKGNDRFEGICIDLIEELSKALQFNYTIRLTPDKAPGSYNETTGKWNGMIGELLDGKADLAIADLTITHERESAVDFTMQFMNLGQYREGGYGEREGGSLMPETSASVMSHVCYVRSYTVNMGHIHLVLSFFKTKTLHFSFIESRLVRRLFLHQPVPHRSPVPMLHV